jgi:uncharacterized membrane protein
MKDSHRRTLVKTVIYRGWVIISTYVMLLLTGQSWDQAIVPTVIMNMVWMTSYYLYERIWNKIEWGRHG